MHPTHMFAWLHRPAGRLVDGQEIRILVQHPLQQPTRRLRSNNRRTSARLCRSHDLWEINIRPRLQVHLAFRFGSEPGEHDALPVLVGRVLRRHDPDLLRRYQFLRRVPIRAHVLHDPAVQPHRGRVLGHTVHGEGTEVEDAITGPKRRLVRGHRPAAQAHLQNAPCTRPRHHARRRALRSAGGGGGGGRSPSQHRGRHGEPIVDTRRN
mmetsp:Transcript_38510/g.110558  ORF Transcript_38510/g.110558 Transcript_38510/m.110558 type:complete len:209 (+) Transcript_38510:304-930(+)